MFKKIDAPDHIFAVHYSDKISAEDVLQSKQWLDENLAKHKSLGALVDFTGLSDMTADAFASGVKTDIDFLRHIGQFHRLAFVSDKEWPSVVLGTISPLVARVEMKLFKPAQREEALTWVAQPPATHVTEMPAFRFLKTSKADVLAFEINGVITAEEMPSVMQEFETFLDTHEKIRLLNRMTHFGGFDPSVLLQSGLVSMKLAAIKKVERYAIVGAPVWMGKIIKTLNPVFSGLDMRTFTADQEDEAWAWLDAKLVG